LAIEAYDQYYSTNFYDRRYPRPNQRTLALLRRHLQPGGTVLDIGAGNGRYALTLAAMGFHVVAVEPSEGGRQVMARRAQEHGAADGISIHAELGEVAPEVIAGASAALLLFGVLGCMTYGERCSLLASLSRSMGPGARMLGSVPNRRRRLRREQRDSRVEDGGYPPRVRYRRASGSGALELEVTLFSPAELSAELVRAGWRCDATSGESVLPEAAVTSRRLVSRLDAAVCSIVPAAAGYCIFFEATNSRPVTGGPKEGAEPLL
jgi:tRNA (uracil-5-)-methyltransferase TRM9